jgi:hypothetical protein
VGKTEEKKTCTDDPVQKKVKRESGFPETNMTTRPLSPDLSQSDSVSDLSDEEADMDPHGSHNTDPDTDPDTDPGRPVPTSLDQEDLSRLLRAWMQADDVWEAHKEQVKAANAHRQQAARELMTWMDTHALRKVNLNKDGAVVYQQRTPRRPLSEKHLRTQLQQLFLHQPGEVDRVCSSVMQSLPRVPKLFLERKRARKQSPLEAT